MKITYDRDENILIIEVLPDEPIDHAEQADSVIAHFNAKGQLVLLEILDANVFMSTLVQAGMKGQAELLPST